MKSRRKKYKKIQDPVQDQNPKEKINQRKLAKK